MKWLQDWIFKMALGAASRYFVAQGFLTEDETREATRDIESLVDLALRALARRQGVIAAPFPGVPAVSFGPNVSASDLNAAELKAILGH